MNHNEQRIPPFNEEAESAVIGCILGEGCPVLDICGEYQLSEESFYIPRFRTIFRHAKSAAAKTGLIDSIGITESLKLAGELESVGGSSAVLKTIDSAPVLAHSEYYVSIVANKARLRAIIEQCRQTEEDCFDSDDQTIDTILGNHSGQMAKIELAHAVQEQEWKDTVRESMEDAERAISSGKSLIGLSTGFSNLDNATLGLKDGEMTVIAARLSHGKTSLAMNIAEHVASGTRDPDGKKHAVGIFSIEMGAKSLAMRMKCSYGRVCYWEMLRKMSRGIPVQSEHAQLVQAASVLSRLNLYVDDTCGIDICQLRIRARRWKKKYGIELLVIDYMQLIHDREYSRQGRQVEVSQISANIKQCAKELNIPVIVLSQLSRKPEDGKRGGIPKLSDIRESGSIEQDADNVWLLRRTCKCDGDGSQDDKTLAVIDVAKQRNGPTGPAHMNFHEEFTRFEDRIEGIDAEEEQWYEDK